MKFNWVTLHVKNLENSLKFYQEIVGLPLARRFKAGPGSEIAFLGDGETQVELIGNSNDKLAGMSPDLSLGFAVESIDAMIALLKDKGVAVHSGPFQPGPNIRFIYVQDPDGLKIQFAENLQ